MLEKNKFIKFTIEHTYIGIIKEVSKIDVDFHIILNIDTNGLFSDISVHTHDLLNYAELTEIEYKSFIKYLNNHKKIWYNNKLITHNFDNDEIVMQKGTSYVMQFSLTYPYYHSAFDIETGNPINLKINVQSLVRPSNLKKVEYCKLLDKYYNNNLNDFEINIQKKLYDDLIDRVNNIKAQLDDFHPRILQQDINKDELNIDIVPKKNINKLYELGEVIYVRNSENEEWIRRFFACKDTTSIGEVVIKTTDGKSWKFYK